MSWRCRRHTAIGHRERGEAISIVGGRRGGIPARPDREPLLVPAIPDPRGPIFSGPRAATICQRRWAASQTIRSTRPVPERFARSGGTSFWPGYNLLTPTACQEKRTAASVARAAVSSRKSVMTPRLFAQCPAGMRRRSTVVRPWPTRSERSSRLFHRNEIARSVQEVETSPLPKRLKAA